MSQESKNLEEGREPEERHEGAIELLESTESTEWPTWCNMHFLFLVIILCAGVISYVVPSQLRQKGVIDSRSSEVGMNLFIFSAILGLLHQALAPTSGVSGEAFVDARPYIKRVSIGCGLVAGFLFFVQPLGEEENSISFKAESVSKFI